jgi:hypothetical protein
MALVLIRLVKVVLSEMENWTARALWTGTQSDAPRMTPAQEAERKRTQINLV